MPMSNQLRSRIRARTRRQYAATGAGSRPGNRYSPAVRDRRVRSREIVPHGLVDVPCASCHRVSPSGSSTASRTSGAWRALAFGHHPCSYRMVVAFTGSRPPVVAAVARGRDPVKQVAALTGAATRVLGGADAHHVVQLAPRQDCRGAALATAMAFSLTHAEAADGAAVELHVGERAGTRRAQLWVGAALDDVEHRLAARRAAPSRSAPPGRHASSPWRCPGRDPASPDYS